MAAPTSHPTRLAWAFAVAVTPFTSSRIDALDHLHDPADEEKTGDEERDDRERLEQTDGSQNAEEQICRAEIRRHEGVGSMIDHETRRSYGRGTRVAN